MNFRSSTADDVISAPVLDLRCVPISNMKAHQLSFHKRNWTGDFDRSCVHFSFHSEFSNILNFFGEDGNPAFSGRHAVKLVQGVTFTPPTGDDIAPFMVYATNCYGRNQSLSHTGSSRFDVVEVNDSDGLPSYRLVLAIFEVEGKGCHFLGAYLELVHKRPQDKLMPYGMYQLKRMPRSTNVTTACFRTDNILRPACFVSTTDTKANYIQWCKKQFDYRKPILFWCFPYEYCDRSRWNTISTTTAEEHEQFINIPREMRENIAKLATIGREESEEEESDSEEGSSEEGGSESSNEDDI